MSGSPVPVLSPLSSSAGQRRAWRPLWIVPAFVALSIGLTGCKLKPKEDPRAGTSEAEASASEHMVATSDGDTVAASSSVKGDAKPPADLDSVMVELRALRTEVGALREEVRTLKKESQDAEEPEPLLAGLLSIDAKPGTASVLIDGEQVADSTPLELHELAPGEHQVQVEFHESGRRSPVHEVVLPSGGLVELVLHDSPEPQPAPPEPAGAAAGDEPVRAPSAAGADEPVRRPAVPEGDAEPGAEGVFQLVP